MPAVPAALAILCSSPSELKLEEAPAGLLRRIFEAFMVLKVGHNALTSEQRVILLYAIPGPSSSLMPCEGHASGALESANELHLRQTRDASVTPTTLKTLTSLNKESRPFSQR